MLWAYVDMDCFFCTLAARDLPPGTPAAVVSGQSGTSEVCSANYAARAQGANVRRGRPRLERLRASAFSRVSKTLDTYRHPVVTQTESGKRRR